MSFFLLANFIILSLIFKKFSRYDIESHILNFLSKNKKTYLYTFLYLGSRISFFFFQNSNLFLFPMSSNKFLYKAGNIKFCLRICKNSLVGKLKDSKIILLYLKANLKIIIHK